MVCLIFVDLAYSEHQETEMLAVFTYANDIDFCMAPNLFDFSIL